MVYDRILYAARLVYGCVIIKVGILDTSLREAREGTNHAQRYLPAEQGNGHMV
jgi:hypothetical protein